MLQYNSHLINSDKESLYFFKLHQILIYLAHIHDLFFIFLVEYVSNLDLVDSNKVKKNSVVQVADGLSGS